MKPVYQTKFGKYGNCFVACLASILEISIKDIPDIEPPKNNELPRMGWITMLNSWLKKDYNLVYVEGVIGWSWIRHVGYHVIGGTSPRDSSAQHAVVGYNGKMVHDPMKEDPKGIITDNMMHYGVFVKHHK